MALKDPTAWISDLTVYMDDEELTRTAEAMKVTMLPGHDRVRTAVWAALVGTAGGVLGGVIQSPAIRGSVFTFLAYLIGAGVLLRGLHPLGVRWLGRGAAWIANQAFFWAFLLAFFAVLGARRESALWAYVISVGVGFFLGMMNGSLTPGVIRNEEAWASVSLLLGPLTAASAAWVLRHLPGGSDPLMAAVLGGAISGGVYSVVMAIVLARLWNEAHGLSQMAMLYLHNENFAPQAVAYLDRAIALAPRDASLFNLRGIAWSRQGQPDRAAEDWRVAAELLPNDPEPQLNQGADCLRRGDLDGAIEALHAALAIRPDHATTHSNLGVAHQRRGELDEAIEHYDRAVELDPDYANAYSNRAYAYWRKGEHARALADGDRAVSLNPRLAMAHVNRAHALQGLGRADEAAGSYRAALLLGPEPSIREECLRELEALGTSASHDDID